MRHRITLVGLALTLLIVGGAGAAPDFASLPVQPYQPPKPRRPSRVRRGLGPEGIWILDLGASWK